MSFSLAPYSDWLVATVTFDQEPLVFMKCQPGTMVHCCLPLELGGDTISVDCDYFGITPLFQPSSEPKYDLVAVSGFSSPGFESWSSPWESHIVWLRDVLPLDFPDFRVLVWGSYEFDLLDPTSTMSIASYGRQLLVATLSAREADTNRPIIFMGYSLGGL
ncbi:hypothetical protein K440DRAFT_600017, partial [Wilcoxina mikolae CBS 423.85]